MSDSVQIENEAYEPDEATLISALRNQDDIPILMDVVTEQVTSAVSQAEYLQQSVNGLKKEPNDELDGTGQQYEELPLEPDAASERLALSSEEVAGNNIRVSQEQIADAIHSVLEKRLPELVQDVVDVLMDPKSK